ncbi:MAG: hypothetical protein K0V04_16825 [Deltaproteobacteria bacterium]|nr:hypothetical protein [Deltaproteobacteria bacterium]
MEWDTEPRRLLRLRDGNDNTIEFQHDAMGRLVERTHWDDTVTRFEWDPMGRLLSLTNPEGGRFEYEHDDFGNMSMRRSPDGTETRYTHDVNGMMLSADDGTHRVEYERDLYGRVTTERVDGVAVDSEYDAVGARVGLRSDEGLDARYGFSPGNRCQTVEAGAGRIEFDYDIQGNEQRRRFGGGGVFQQRHDPMGRVVDQWFAPPGSDPQTPARHVEPDDPAAPFRRVFTYDAGGHISSMRDSLRGGWSFTHDGAGQLQSVTQIDGLTELFEYDGAGNRRGAARVPSDRAPGVEQSFVAGARGERNLDRQGLRQRGAELEEQTVGPGNRVTVVRRGATTLRYEFDALGRVVVKQRDDVEGTAVWRLTWNDTHQLVRLDNPAGETWTYDYDPLGRRLGKSDGTRTFAYTWDQDRLLHVRDDQGLHTIIEHPYLASTLMHLRDGAVEYVLPDPIGATSEVVRPDGTLARRRAQGPWGEARDEQPVVPFPGQLEDEESGLLYNQCRYYDPELGRYLSPDPIGLVGGLNDYSYVPSPMEWVDPDGLYITGGPYANPGGVPDPNSSTPRATGSDGTTRVTNPNTGNDNVVPPPSGTGRGGKTLAVLQDPNAPSDQVAFVSGHGRPDAPTRPGQGDWHTTNGPFGNWCHAEMHAAAWLLDNGHSLRGRTLDLVIDRPPCRHCNGSLRQAMDRLRADFGIDLRVRYFQHVDESASGGRTRGWHDFC